MTELTYETDSPAPTLPFPEAMDLFRDYMAFRNLAHRTRVEYTTDLRMLFQWLEQTKQIADLSKVRLTNLEDFLAYMDRLGFAGSSRRRKTVSIKALFAFLSARGYLSQDPARELIPPRAETQEPRVLSEAEYKRLLDVVRYHTRDRAIIELILQTGMRLSEVARLPLQSLEVPAKANRDSFGSVTIIAKGRKTRTVFLNSRACQALRAYLNERPDINSQYLFVTKFKTAITPRSIERAVDKHLKAANISDASVHTLRHTFATHHVKKGTNLKSVQEMLGHASLETTNMYVHLAKEQLAKEMQENAL
jgi:site-specific recombinase XerD